MNINTYSDEFFGESRRVYGENRDCTVIAVAAAFDTSYEHAHWHLRNKCSRPKNRGIRFDMVFPGSVPEGVVERIGYKLDGNNITVGRFCKENPEGRYVVLVRGHALAVIDGEIYDHSYKPRRHVQAVYKVLDKLPG